MTRVPQLFRIIPVALLLLLFGCHDAQAPTAPTREGPLAVLVGTGFPLAQVSAGFSHTCGVTGGGQAFCWGDNTSGQLGSGTFGLVTAEPAPVAVAGELTFLQVSAGLRYTCGVAKGGQAYCWGNNTHGQLGNGVGSTDRPVPVAGGLTFAQVAAGQFHTCGVAKGGQLFCWGFNSVGQLGIGTSGSGTDKQTPVPVVGAVLFTQVTVGGDHTCAVAKDGHAYCWGSDIAGQLGNGPDAGTTHAPMPVAGGLTFLQVGAGVDHTCGVAKGGEAYCWGSDIVGQLGNGPDAGSTDAPVPVAGGLTFAQINQTFQHTCGVAKGGEAYCWGPGGLGQLGNGAHSLNEQAPVAVLGGLTFTQVSGGFAHTCGVSKANGAYCWGDDTDGQLGNGAATGSTDAPSPVSSPGS